jgi:mannosyltransferase OCH1-like enzyme
MIPKKLHYIWLSNDPLPQLPQLCIDSWKRHCPDYEIVHWDMAKCQKIIDTVPFVREAVSLSKWAFASDYIRLYAVYSEGGIYLDSDVYMYQSFDPFLDNRYFTNVEFTSHYKKNKSWQFLNEDGTKKDPNQIVIPGIALQAAIFGGEAGHPFLKKCMEYYEKEKFILPNGELNIKNISPCVYSHTAQQYGFVYKNELQKLSDGMTIYPGDVFLPSLNESKTKPFAIHVTNGSWRPLWQRIKNFLRNAPRGTIESRLAAYENKKPVEL